MLRKEQLEKLYQRGFSAKEIANKVGYSESGVRYLLSKYSIPRRTISEAIYVKNNPRGDPFKIKENLSFEEAKLLGLGLGIFWGEGNKRSKCSVRVGNSDPKLIRKFIEFLDKICGVGKEKLKFNLQIFSDLSEDEVVDFWMDELKIERVQFFKVIITPYRSLGNYNHKSNYGVITINFNNTKLKKIIDEMLANL